MKLKPFLKLFTIVIFSLLVMFQGLVVDQIFASKRVHAELMPMMGICQYGNCPTMYYNNCVVTLKPDIAVIQGGISVEGKKPKQAKAELDGKINKVKEYVSDLGAGSQVKLKGTVRGSKNGQHVVGESIEVRVLVDADIDSLLEKLPTIGFNKFGQRWMQNNSNNNPQASVMYRASNTEKAVDVGLEKCKKKAWENWCRTNMSNYAYRAACDTDYNKITDNLNITSLYFNASNILNEQFYNTSISLNYPWQQSQIDTVQSADSGEIHLIGNINMQFAPDLK